MENPYSEEHFLRRYWCYKPSIIDRDRRLDGDWFKKPTQYWFLNTEPKNNLIFEPLEDNSINEINVIEWVSKDDAQKMGARTVKQARSMIHPQYANRFIRKYILEEGENNA